MLAVSPLTRGIASPSVWDDFSFILFRQSAVKAERRSGSAGQAPEPTGTVQFPKGADPALAELFYQIEKKKLKLLRKKSIGRFIVKWKVERLRKMRSLWFS